MNRTKLVSLTLALGLLLGVIYLFKFSRVKELSSSYQIARVEEGDIIQSVSANGTLNPVTVVNVGAQINGQVQKIYADFNDHVQAGEILLELDTTLLKTRVEQSLAAVAKAQAYLELATANLERSRSLYRQNFISRQEWNELHQKGAAAKAELQLAEAKLARNQANLAYATIRSPVAGIVVDRQINEGQTITTSFQTPVLFKIAQDLKKMQIDSNFAEADIGGIRAGQVVSFTTDAFADRVFSGVVKQIRLTPNVQQNVVTYNVVIEVDNAEHLLLPGMTAYVTIQLNKRQRVLRVPNAALRFRPAKQPLINLSQATPAGQSSLYRLTARGLQVVNCKLGISDGRYTEIISGEIQSGDRIVIGERAAASKSSFSFKAF